MKLNRSRFWTALHVLSMILFLCFIYAKSLETGSVSSESSNAVVSIIQGAFPNVDTRTLSYIIRKLAHFSEFFILGLLYHTFCLKRIKTKKTLILAVLSGYMFGAIDEIIQTFVEGRVGNLVDTFIDYSGFLFSLLIILLIRKIIFRKGVSSLENKN